MKKIPENLVSFHKSSMNVVAWDIFQIPHLATQSLKK